MVPRHLAPLCLLAFLCPVAAKAETHAAPASQSCPLLHSTPSPGDIALANLQFATAEELYARDREASGAAGDRAHVAWIHVLLDEEKLDEAGKAAKEWSAASPQSPWSQDAMSQVLLRMGDIPGAAGAIQAAFAADHCNPWVRAEFAHIYALNSMNAAALKMMASAHALAPDDLQIEIQWLTFPRIQAGELDRFLKHADFLTSEVRTSLQDLRDRALQSGADACHLVTPLKTTSIPYRAIQNGPKADVFWGLNVGFNGKQARMEIDTAASGLTITKAAADAMHLSVQHAQAESVTGNVMGIAFAGVKDLKIGNLEFADCDVRVVDHLPRTADGLIGANVFQNFLVTLDFPGHTLKLAPLPALPGAAQIDSLEMGDPAASPQAQDRYVDPTMKDWTQALRLGPELIIAAKLGTGPNHLFLLSTAAKYDFVSSAEPHHLVHEYRDDGTGGNTVVRRRSGIPVSFDIDRTAAANLYFGNVHLLENDGLRSFDNTRLGNNVLGIYGVLGAQSLDQMTVSIDYRDGLIRFNYDPSRVPHCDPAIVMPGCY